MCLKSVLVTLLVCVALYPGDTKADSSDIPQDFEQVIFDFFEQYNNKTTDDKCKPLVPEIIIDKESFEKSKFYQELEKYFTDYSKCEEEQCSTVMYELGELVKIDKEKLIEIEDTSTTESSTSSRITTSSESEETTSVTDTSSSGNGLETTESWQTTTESWQTTTESWLTTTENEQNATESGFGTAESSKLEENSEQRPKNGTQTAVIVVSSMAAVAATASAAFYGVPWIKAILQSGTYRFPATPGV